MPNIGYIGWENRESLQHYSNTRHERLRPHSILVGSEARARAEREWTRLFNDSKKCFHAQPCHRKGGQCRLNSRLQTEAVIAGAILPLWNALDEFTWTGQANDKFMRVTRVRLTDGTRIVGVAVPWFKLQNWRGQLQKAGVPIDADALGAINVIEKDAADGEKRGKADKLKAAKHE